MKLHKPLVFLVLITAFTGLVAAQPNTDTEPYVIGFDPGAGPDIIQQVGQHGGDITHEYDYINAIAADLPSDAVHAFREREQIRYVDEDTTMYALSHSGDPYTEQVVPWGIDRVDAPLAHSESTGTGVDIAIIDTGIDSDHEDLADNVVGGKSFASGNWEDGHGHGTHVAGTAAALDNNVGVIGAAHSANLWAVKVLNNGGRGSCSDVAAGIEWAASQGHEVLSMSLGGGGCGAMSDAVTYAYNEGSLLVAAAGNDGSCTDCVSYPAAYDEVIAVSAVDSDDTLASFSSTGPEVEITAPGVDVLSTVPDNNYNKYSGTSMAAPHVSGVAALVFAQDSSLANTDVRQQLQDTAEDLGLSSNEQGSGLVDAEAAVNLDSLSVVTHDATSVTETATTLNGELTDLGGASSADVWFKYRTEGTSTWTTTPAETLSATGTFNADLSGLDNGTTYEFRAVAETSDGTRDEGNTLSFTTPQLTVTTQDATGVRETNATLNGELTDLGDAVEADVWFEWREAGTSSWSDTANMTLNATGTFSHELTDLTAETTYEFRAVAVADYGVEGDVRTFETGTFAVETNEATDVNENGATLNGDLTDLGDEDEADVYFEWRAESDSSWTTTSAETLSTAGTFSEALTGLASNTTYEFHTVAESTDGDRVVTGVNRTFTTDEETVESAPVIDQFTVTDTSNPRWARAKVDWTASDADADLYRVELEIYDASGSRADSATWTDVSGAEATGQYEFRERDAHGEYDFVLTVTDAAGNTVSDSRTKTLG